MGVGSRRRGVVDDWSWQVIGEDRVQSHPFGKLARLEDGPVQGHELVEHVVKEGEVADGGGAGVLNEVSVEDDGSDGRRRRRGNFRQLDVRPVDHGHVGAVGGRDLTRLVGAYRCDAVFHREDHLPGYSRGFPVLSVDEVAPGIERHYLGIAGLVVRHRIDFVTRVRRIVIYPEPLHPVPGLVVVRCQSPPGSVLRCQDRVQLWVGILGDHQAALSVLEENEALSCGRVGVVGSGVAQPLDRRRLDQQICCIFVKAPRKLDHLPELDLQPDSHPF